jgi:aspartate kinase
MAFIVQKYGGTSVGDVDRIKNVARRVARAHAQGNDIVVIVSAMAGETDRLLGLSHSICDRPDERETDVLLSTGETASTALLAMALRHLGAPAVSFQGHQVRIETDSEFMRARIRSIDAPKLYETLRQRRIAVIAGFQGIDPQGNITTLGRGGSDTTAVAVAAAMKAEVCEIYTDVNGVYSADPNVVPTARKLPRISYEEMLELASMGAKVLQTRSVEFATKYRVPVHVRSSFHDGDGTWVVEEDAGMEEVLVSAVAHDRNQAKITFKRVADQPGIAARIFSPLAEAGIVLDVIVQNVSEEGTTDVTFTVPKTDLTKARELCERTARDLGCLGLQCDDRIAKVSIVGAGMRSHAGVAAKMFSALSREGINIEMISTSEIKISCVIDTKYAELAVRVLHDAFGLGDEARAPSR